MNTETLGYVLKWSGLISGISVAPIAVGAIGGFLTIGGSHGALIGAIIAAALPAVIGSVAVTTALLLLVI